MMQVQEQLAVRMGSPISKYYSDVSVKSRALQKQRDFVTGPTKGHMYIVTEVEDTRGAVANALRLHLHSI